MKPEKLTIKQLKKIWGVELDNILDEVEAGRLDMYVRRATWKYDASECKDEISVYLAGENITGTLENFKTDIKQLPFVREQRNNDSFRLLVSGDVLDNGTIGQYEFTEQRQSLIDIIKYKIADRLLFLNAEYKKSLPLSLCSGELRSEAEKHRTKNQIKRTKIFYELLKPNRETIAWKKIEILDELINNAINKNYIGWYKVLHFLPLPLEKNLNNKVKISLTPKPYFISEPISFDDIYFLEKDIQSLENKEKNITSLKKNKIKITKAQQDKLDSLGKVVSYIRGISSEHKSFKEDEIFPVNKEVLFEWLKSDNVKAFSRIKKFSSFESFWKDCNYYINSICKLKVGSLNDLELDNGTELLKKVRKNSLIKYLK